ncbi:hypothetical protein AB0H00_22975 [Nocardia sp. NPDC023852]|uniref:hypothetical protein n=1 Tax=Nocardia sp. NPDC023852 TaxID=3154697 RepID=UPI0034024C3F
MADTFAFKSGHAGKIQKEMVDLADEVNVVSAEMEAVFQEYWGCWGTGETGRTIADGENNDGLIAGYKSQVEVFKSYEDFANGPEGFGPAFGEAKKKLIAMEEHNRQILEYNKDIRAFNEQVRDQSQSREALDRARQALERRGEVLERAGKLRK